jgi:hypothetical protein
MEFFQTLFHSLKREMHQEFDDIKARLDRMEARPEPHVDPEWENWKTIEAWAARPGVPRATHRLIV